MESNKPTDPNPPDPAAPASEPLVVGGPEVDPPKPEPAADETVTEAATTPLARIEPDPDATELLTGTAPLAAAELPAEPAPTATVEPAPATPSDEERERRLAAVEAARAKLLAALQTAPRAKAPDIAAVAAEYTTAAHESPDPAAEWDRLRAGVAGWPPAGPVAECDQIRADMDQLAASYAALFAGLAPVEAAVAAELARTADDDPALLAAPAELRESSDNYKKGLQIIQRMFSRLHARRKPLDAIPPLAAPPALPDAAPPPAEWAARLTEFNDALAGWSAAAAGAIREARKKADGVRREVNGFVVALLGPLDGIEAGLRNEPDLLARLEAFRPDHGPAIDGWVRAYERLDAALHAYFGATGLTPLTAARGAPFHPDTMEPGGTVYLPDRPAEEVVSVMRRGYALNGAQLRPVQVEVVVHSPTDGPE